MPDLENATTVTSGRFPRPHSPRRPLPHRFFQMEPYRASSLFPDLQKLGWRTPRQLSQDPSLHSFHQNSIRHVGQCSSRPSPLSDRHRTYTATTSSTPRQAPPNPPQVELHYLTQSVKLFLRRSLRGKLYIMTREMLKWRRSLNRRRLQGWQGQFAVEAILEVMTIGVLTYAVACLFDLIYR